MDDDSIPTPNALEKLMEVAENIGEFGFLASKVLWKDKSMCNMNVPKITLNRKLQDYDGNPKRIIMGTFVSFFVPMKVVKEVGLPIKEFLFGLMILSIHAEFHENIRRTLCQRV